VGWVLRLAPEPLMIIKVVLRFIAMIHKIVNNQTWFMTEVSRIIKTQTNYLLENGWFFYWFFHENHHVFDFGFFRMIGIGGSIDVKTFKTPESKVLTSELSRRPKLEVSNKIQYPPNTGNFSCLYLFGPNEGDVININPQITTFNHMLLVCLPSIKI
jgi:hypothetical protein